MYTFEISGLKYAFLYTKYQGPNAFYFFQYKTIYEQRMRTTLMHCLRLEVASALLQMTDNLI